MTPQQPLAQPTELWTTFCGNIDGGTVNRLLNALALATQNNVTALHILFQSAGGIISDGICLYNALRTYPVPLTLYNAGGIMSVAVVAFLGAKTRKASAHAVFNLHRSTFSPQSASAGTLESLAEAVLLEDKRTEAILRRHMTLTDEQWKDLDRHSAGLWLTAEQALEATLVTEIGEFAPPVGAKIYNL
jgi:ATP-dependent Clp protease protease subunit